LIAWGEKEKEKEKESEAAGYKGPGLSHVIAAETLGWGLFLLRVRIGQSALPSSPHIYNSSSLDSTMPRFQNDNNRFRILVFLTP
jgi:hypothetical protein